MGSYGSYPIVLTYNMLLGNLNLDIFLIDCFFFNQA